MKGSDVSSSSSNRVTIIRNTAKVAAQNGGRATRLHRRLFVTLMNEKDIYLYIF